MVYSFAFFLLIGIWLNNNNTPIPYWKKTKKSNESKSIPNKGTIEHKGNGRVMNQQLSFETKKALSMPITYNNVVVKQNKMSKANISSLQNQNILSHTKKQQSVFA
jgi:hypothetical protein